MTDLSPLMWRILEALEEIEREEKLRAYGYGYPAAPNAIGARLKLPRVEGGGSGSGRGSGHRVFGEAQRIIFPLSALVRRGLVYSDRRPDGLSGSAYGLTDEAITLLSSRCTREKEARDGDTD